MKNLSFPVFKISHLGLSQRFSARLRHGTAVLAAVLLVVWTMGTTFIYAAVPAQTLDTQKQTQVINRIIDTINENYVFADVAKNMGEHILKQLKKGAYKKITDPAEFATVLTKDLRDICHDLHLRVNYFPEPPRQRPDAPQDPEEIRRRLSYSNFGFEKVQRLAGNVGYLKLNGFIGAEYGGATAVAAMNFLANCDALIVDLRQNGGGQPSMIQLINSYFFDEPVHLNSFYIRKGDKTQQFWTQAHVQGKRMTQADIYVLTSKRTFSGAEEFTYNLKNMKRGTIIGETTGGGAHPVRFHYFEELQFGIRVPFGRAINPISGTNWEGTGIKPDIEVPQEKAYDTAYKLAVKNLLTKTKTPEEKRRLESDINIGGYRLLDRKKVKEAIKIFEMNVELFPESFNVYDSLAEAYMTDNNKELAIKYYKKSLELNPENENAKKFFKEQEAEEK
jgi:hypothetical protein